MDQSALKAFFRKLDRSFFIDNNYKTHAAEDRPLPIGKGQTISQPSLVLEMTGLLSPEKDSRVLEIGTGSGYQTAFLAEFSGQVYTIEKFHEFMEKAQSRISALGYSNVLFKTGDGSDGWAEHAPFDRIMVTAAAGNLPDTLVDQLGPGGRMLVPVGTSGIQMLKLITKNQNGSIDISDVEMVRFVELQGRYGWNDR
jgi:protein-L-isoaspartate(D-aspartate) O-methyltransferase